MIICNFQRFTTGNIYNYIIKIYGYAVHVRHDAYIWQRKPYQSRHHTNFDSLELVLRSIINILRSILDLSCEWWGFMQQKVQNIILQ